MNNIKLIDNDLTAIKVFRGLRYISEIKPSFWFKTNQTIKYGVYHSELFLYLQNSKPNPIIKFKK